MDKVERAGEGGEGEAGTWVKEAALRAREGGPTTKPGGLGVLQGKGAWKLATQVPTSPTRYGHPVAYRGHSGTRKNNKGSTAVPRPYSELRDRGGQKKKRSER